MKKSKCALSLLIVLMLAVVLSACGGGNDSPVPPPTQIESLSVESTAIEMPSAELIPSERVPQNPTEMFTLLMDEENIVFYYAPGIIFTTTAEENGLGETYMYIRGVVNSVDLDVEGMQIALFIETEYGILGLGKDGGHDGQDFLSNSYDWSLLEIGNEHGFFFTYLGFSALHDVAAGVFLNIDVESRADTLRSAVEELTSLYSEAGVVVRVSLDDDGNNGLVAEIIHGEPHDINDFPALVIASVDNVIRVADEHSIVVSRLDVGFDRGGRLNFVTYRSRNEGNNNDGLMRGDVLYSSYNSANHTDIRYDEIPTYAEEVAAGIARLSEILTITSVTTSRPNSAGGVDFSINWHNNSDTTINYITFTVPAYNAVDDRVSCEIRRAVEPSFEFTGPFIAGSANTSPERNAWYNHNIVRADITRIEIRYADDTRETIHRNLMGFNEWIQ